ncbi:MAG: DMT family transporter [Sulfurospirillum sp.]|nr:DMT family transporter [Sulfurospirillum sp.]
MPALSDTIKGMFFAAFGVGVISFDALLVRLADTDASLIAFYRGFFMGIIMLFVWILKGEKESLPKNRHDFIGIILVSLLSGIGTSLFVFSIKNTIAANTVVLLATASFFGALFSYLLLREKIAKQTLAAILLSFVGVLIIVGNSLSLGGNILGDFLGVMLAVSMGLQLTLLRKFPHFSHYFIISLSGFLLMAIMWAVVKNPFDIAPMSLFWLFLMGAMQVVAMYFIYGATRYISSAEVGVFSTIETTLAPIWLWLFVGEIAPAMTILGGAFVVAAIFINAYPHIRFKKR